MAKNRAYGVLELVMGLMLLVLGVFTFYNRSTTLTTFVFVYGAFSIAFGLMGIGVFIWLSLREVITPVSVLILGILNILMGILLVSNVWASLMALSFLFPFWMILLCTSRLCDLEYIRKYAGSGVFWFSMLVNVLGLVLGFLLLFLPGIALTTMAWVIGFYLLLAAMEMMILAVRNILYGKR